MSQKLFCFIPSLKQQMASASQIKKENGDFYVNKALFQNYVRISGCNHDDRPVLLFRVSTESNDSRQVCRRNCRSRHHVSPYTGTKQPMEHLCHQSKAVSKRFKIFKRTRLYHNFRSTVDRLYRAPHFTAGKAYFNYF